MHPQSKRQAYPLSFHLKNNRKEKFVYSTKSEVRNPSPTNQPPHFALPFAFHFFFSPFSFWVMLCFYVVPFEFAIVAARDERSNSNGKRVNGRRVNK